MYKLLTNFKRLYNKWDRKFVERFPKKFRIYAPFAALVILFFDAVILLFVKFMITMFGADPHSTEIYTRVFLYIIIIVFGPKQLFKIINKLK